MDDPTTFIPDFEEFIAYMKAQDAKGAAALIADIQAFRKTRELGRLQAEKVEIEKKISDLTKTAGEQPK